MKTPTRFFMQPPRFHLRALALIMGMFFSLTLHTQIAYGVAPKTALPEGTKICATYELYIQVEQAFNRQKENYDIQERVNVANAFKGFTRDEQYEVIACSLKSGRFHLFMVPYMIRYFVEVMIQLAGLICVLYIVVGAYQYMLGSITENKQQGKDTIKHALIGLVITLMAWIIVNVVQVALT